jgi:quercetin dioxygenase-like cupin family protein
MESGGLSEQDVLVPAGEGELITDRESREVALIAVRDDITMTRSRYGPGERGPDAHVHHEHTDSFYVLDGELTFALGHDDELVTVGAGGFVAVPPNVSHSFRNEGSTEANFLNLHTPDGGFAAFMRGARDGTDIGFDSFDPPADGGRPASDAIVLSADEGERFEAGNRLAVVKAVLPQICFVEFAYDGPRDGPPVHDHDAQVDSFYVLEGEMEFQVGDSVHPGGPGTLASIPRGVRHTFRHIHDGRARVLNIHAPDCGFGEFIRGPAS